MLHRYLLLGQTIVLLIMLSEECWLVEYTSGDTGLVFCDGPFLFNVPERLRGRIVDRLPNWKLFVVNGA